MLLQTNTYFVPKDKRAEHTRLMRRFKQTLARLGCDAFEVFERVGDNWGRNRSEGEFVQIMRFRDRAHYQIVQAAEREDQSAQQLIREFCELVDFEAQREQGQYKVGFLLSALPVASTRIRSAQEQDYAPHIEADQITLADDISSEDHIPHAELIHPHDPEASGEHQAIHDPPASEVPAEDLLPDTDTDTELDNESDPESDNESEHHSNGNSYPLPQMRIAPDNTDEDNNHAEDSNTPPPIPANPTYSTLRRIPHPNAAHRNGD